MDKRRLLFVVMTVFLCISKVAFAGNSKELTNWTDGGSDYDNKYAYDTSWYDSSASEYTISTPEEMGAFAAASMTDSFEGKTVKLAADLDMSKYGWTSIGKAGFKGTFDGMGHTIKAMSYKDEAQAKAWGLFHTIDGGTVENVLVTSSTFANDKSSTDGKTPAECPSVGGIAAILKGNGKIANCGISATVHLPFANAAEELGKFNGLAGGLVGIIESGTVANSFVINNSPTIPNDTIYGNIAGKSDGTILNCYYLENETHQGAVNANQAQGAQEQVSAKPADDFASGVVAYLLNSGDNVGAWGQNNDLPTPVGEATTAIYKISYPQEQPNGKVTGPEYVRVGERVELVSVADEGYFIKDLSVIGAELNNYTNFVMPANDVTVSYTVAELSGSEVTAFPAEDIRSKSFVARWSVVDGATDYKLTVKRNGVALESYDGLSVGDVTSALVEGLAQSTTYTYTVQSVIGTTVSAESNSITVVTSGVEVWAADVEAHALKMAWDHVDNAAGYSVTITDGAGVSTTAETTGCEYRFTGLANATTYTVVVVANDASGEPMMASNPFSVTTASDYGTQLTNSTFEAWEKEGDEAEPVGWNSFMSGHGNLSGFTKTVHMDRSDIVRPESSGNASVRIWTKAVFGSIVANGNLTTGRIHSGSMTPTSQDNHNRSLIDDSEFSQPLGGARPDSLTVWVNYTHGGDTELTARIAATIHDSYSYADPSATTDSLHAVAKAELNYKAVDPKNGGWQRLTIPFDYELKGYDAFYERMNNSEKWKDSLGVDKFVKPTSADYMLVTFTTNSRPAAGFANDQVLIDDMVLVYKPVLKLTKSTYLSGEKITVDYSLTGTMSPSNINKEPNVVSLELSDASGSFANPTVLSTIMTDKGGQLTAEVTNDLTAGSYKIRVVTTNYPMVSEEFSVATGLPVVNVNAATEVEGTGFMAHWDAPSVEPTKYLLTVEQGDAIVGDYNEIEVGTVTSYAIEGLQPNTAYTYTVQAVYDGVSSGASQAMEVVTVPVVRTLTATDIEENSFVANWEAPATVQPTNYLLTVKQGDHVLKDFDDKEVGTATGLKIESLEKNTIYTYTVKAVYGRNVAKASEPIEVTTLVPAMVALDATDVETNAFVANWEAPVDIEASGYLLTVKEGESVVDGFNDLEAGNVTSYKVEGLKANTAYTYTVKAVYEAVVSSASNVIEVTTLQAVGMENVPLNSAVSVYPNPVVEFLYINGVTVDSGYAIYDMSGKIVDKGYLILNKIDVTGLGSGMYFVETESGKAKFIKK